MGKKAEKKKEEAKKRAKEYKRNSDGKEDSGYLNEQQVRAIISNELINMREPMRMAGGSIQSQNFPTGGGFKIDKNGIAQGSDPSIQGWGNTMTFSPVDADTVQWSAGSITLTDGTIYAISAGNTGNMSALTYIYFDANYSVTILRTTTVQSTAVGRNKILVGVAQNNAGSEATFQIFGGSGGLLLKADNIAANSITANEIAANSITTGQLSATAINGMTITGAYIQTATTGARVVLNGTALYFYIDASIEGYVVPDGVESMIYSADRYHRFFKNDGTWMGEITANGMNLASGKSYNFASGRGITDLGSALKCSGDFVPSSDETGGLGYSNRKWDNIYANKVWQSTNTNGSRQVYDFAYIEMNLLPKRLINKRTKKGVMLSNGYVPGLELPFKQGTVLKWTSKGLKESTKETDFAVAVADEKGLPIVLGAEPVRVIGKAKIGDYIVPSNVSGCAMAVSKKDYDDQDIIGRCLKNKKTEHEENILVMIK